MFDLIERYKHDLDASFCISMQPEYGLLLGISNKVIHT